MVVLSILVLSLSFGILFAVLVSIQPTYDITYGIADAFPWWFALTSLLAMTSSLVNARYVGRLGMRYMISIAMIGQTLFSSLMVVIFATGILPDGLAFPVYFVWVTSIFWMVGRDMVYAVGL